MTKKIIKTFFALMTILFAFSITAFSATRTTMAFVSVKNLDINPQYDYLSGLIQGILLFDLTHVPEIELVERQNMEKVLTEQELQLSGLSNDMQGSLKIGKILGAKYLIFAEYIYMGSEVLLNLKAVSVETGRVMVFTSRGSGENIIHSVAEQLVEQLAGKKIVFQSKDDSRSIISLKNETPGSIALHSIMARAEIYMDGEFAGYTTGDVKVPFIIDNLKPGKHIVRVHPDYGFGVVIEPEILFKDWEVAVNIEPGKKLVLRDETRHFNDRLYNISRLYNKYFNYTEIKFKELETPLKLSFADKEKKNIEITIDFNPSMKDGKPVIKPEIIYNKKKYPLDFKLDFTKENSLEQKIEKINLNFKLNYTATPPYFEFNIWRNDVWQGMYEKGSKKPL